MSDTSGVSSEVWAYSSRNQKALGLTVNIERVACYVFKNVSDKKADTLRRRRAREQTASFLYLTKKNFSVFTKELNAKSFYLYRMKRGREGKRNREGEGQAGHREGGD